MDFIDTIQHNNKVIIPMWPKGEKTWRLQGPAVCDSGSGLPWATLLMQSRYRRPCSSYMNWPLALTILMGSWLKKILQEGLQRSSGVTRLLETGSGQQVTLESSSPDVFPPQLHGLPFLQLLHRHVSSALQVHGPPLERAPLGFYESASACPPRQ